MIINSTANMASPLLLQLAYPIGYVDDLGPDAIPLRKAEHSPLCSTPSDFELVEQPCRKCPFFGTVCHDS